VAFPDRVTAVVLAYKAEPVLEECVQALLASRGVRADVVLVDNGCTDCAVDRLEPLPGVAVVRPGVNTGFAGGCNLGASRSRAEFVAFVNGDAVVEPDALARLVAELRRDPGVGLVSASLRLYDQPSVINSVGNPIHFSGLSWAGGLGEPADRHLAPSDITGVTGAAVLTRSATFAALGGFYEAMFAYHEDADLSLRAWQRGWRCRYAPDAVVRHRYEFSRNPEKMYLVERNRLLFVLTLYERRTLLLLAPALLALEGLILAVAVRQGWGHQKVRGWWWLLKNRGEICERRRTNQAVRRIDDAGLAHLLTGDFAPAAETGMLPPGAARRLSRLYWSAVRRCLGAEPASPESRPVSGAGAGPAADR